ncbi:phage portal protein [Brucella pseudogrignonensis]|uniref:phage portal protein n=1 Tax=Brucella pseudogrignonensis TaxID=419475 RepID=UPI00190A7587|nr:phage portal protein [Brucella pseudogrignonensis]MBK0020548.1 phage portal protein [Ochrobactrum sp. S45]MBK0042712.1 phage portal protein [Ochrobactrum sp. S46]UKK91737.1 phage portal protein [Brucella pseudogrignonensis]
MAWNWPWRRGAANAPSYSEAGRERKSANGFVALHMERGASWIARDYTSLAREGFMRNPVAHRCVRLIAEAASNVPWLLYEGMTEHEVHPLLDLIATPQCGLDGSSFFERLYGHLLISGNAYVERVDLPSGRRELHLLRPERVTLETSSDGWPQSLVYRSANTSRMVSLAGAGCFGLHLKLFHPLDDHYGFPPLEAALMALDLHNAAGAWNKALLDNSARPSGALVYAPKDGGNLTEEQFDRLKTELEEGYTGASGAGRPLLLEGGLDWKAMGYSPQDMDFIEAKNGAARDIALAFGVPPMLLGIPGDNTYANYAEANRAFYRLTVLPLINRTAKAFGCWLGPIFGSDLRLEHDTDRIEGLSLERESLWRRVSDASFLSDDEKRDAVGYQPRAERRVQ